MIAFFKELPDYSHKDEKGKVVIINTSGRIVVLWEVLPAKYTRQAAHYLSVGIATMHG